MDQLIKQSAVVQNDKLILRPYFSFYPGLFVILMVLFSLNSDPFYKDHQNVIYMEFVFVDFYFTGECL